MSQPRQGSCGGRRISALLFSLLSRVGGWLDAWRRRCQARRADAATAQGTSRLSFEALEPRLLLSADLVAGSLSHNAFDPALPGDPVGALFEIHRPDSEPLSGPIRIQLYASTDNSLDAADTPVGQADIPASQLQPGANAISLSLDTRAVAEPGRYALIGVIDPDNTIGESDEGNNQAIANQDFNLAFRVGQLPGRNPVPAIEFADADGTRVTLAISGPGIADLSADGTGYRLTISGSDASTRVELTGSGGDGRVMLSGISAASPLGSLNAAIASLEGAATFAAAGSLVLGDIAAGARLDGNSLASLSVTRDALGDLRLAGSGVSGFVLGSAQVGGAIGGLWSIGGRGNSVSAQTTRADWRANFSAPLTQLAVRGDASGQFAASALQILQVGGSLKGMAVRIGANLGSDAVPGGSGDAADHFGPGTLARLRISGDIEDSTIVVGIDPRNGTYLDGDDQQLGTPTQRVQELLVGGQLKGSTQIVAPAFPASVRVGGATVNPANLAQLSTSTPDAIPPVLTANLVHDTGADTSDRLTNDPTIHGQATDAGGIRRLLVALDATSPTLLDVSHTLQSDGRFVLADTLLDALAGGRLGDGAQTIRLLAEDTAGNRSAAMTVSFTLDRAVATPGLQLALDSGRDNHDRITHTGMLDIAGSEAGASLEYSIDAGVSWTPDFTAAEGDNSVAVRQTDRAGNVSLSGTLAFVLDTFAPAPPGIDLLASSDSGLLTDDNLTRDTTPTLALTSEAGTMITLRRGTTVVAGSLPGPQADFTSEVLADGEAHFFAISEDLAGNRSLAGELLITIDTLVPTLTLALANDTGRSAGDGLTSDATMRGTLSDDRGVTILSGGFGTDLASFAGLLDLVQPDGTFTIDAGRLAAILGVPPADGPYTLRLHAEDAAGNAQAVAFAFAHDTQAPSLTAALANDTGAQDGITRDPTINGNAGDPLALTVFSGSFGTDLASFANLLDLVQPDGSFTIDAARLATVLGDQLTDGAHTLRLVAVDAAGNRSPIVERAFILDTAAPAFAGFGLSVSDASNAALDETSAATAQIKGHADAGATIRLASQNIEVLAGAGGAFVMPGVALALGTNQLTLTATDAAGNATTLQRTLTRTTAVQSDAVLAWNEIALRAVQLDVTDPPVATRTLAMVSLAQYDALAAIDGTPAYLVSRSISGPASAPAAVAVAAHRVLSLTYPAQSAVFDAVLAADLATIADGEAKDRGIALGLAVADAVLALRANDGSEDFVAYDGGTAIGAWRPTGPMFDVADDPQWGTVQPFALRSPDQYRPAAPPPLDTAAYATAVEEVKRLGSASSSERTADQTEQALFWADGKGSYTPPGHWNQIAEEVARAQGNSLAANAQLFAQLNVALADAAIACWDAKYTHGLWRPETAIQNADLDNNAATILDSAWRPLLLTPAHPEYVSGHSSFSMAAATVLAANFGDATSFTTTSPTLPGVTRSFGSFTQAAQEAGRSRIYGGIHYEFTNQVGQQLGTQVGNTVLARFALTSDTQAPAIVLGDAPAATNTNLTLSGQVLDNLSGVATAQFQIDGGALEALVLDASGGFTITTALASDGSADGAHTITIVASDAAGNANAGVTRGFVLDTTPPTLLLNSLADGDALGAASRLTGTTDATGSALTQLSYRIDGGTSRSLIFDGSGTFDESLAHGDLDVGSHTLLLTARDAAGNVATLSRTLTVNELAPLVVSSLTPTDGSDDVGVTQRPQVRFSRAVDVATLTADSFYATGPDGSKLAATIVPGNDGTFAWLFFTNPMPGASWVTLQVDGSKIRGAGDGSFLDADGDGTAGGTLTQRFTTVSRSAVIGTTLVGKVVDPGPDLEPMSFDDIRRGPDGVIHTSDDVFLLPIAHAKVYILGQENQFVYTDAEGNFELTDTPAGTVKVAVDGRTATNAPAGVFFPEMVIDVELHPGVANTVMGGMGSAEERLANLDRREIYLPRVPTNALQPVSDTVPTVITLTDAASAPQLTAQERAALTLTVNPGSAIGEDGQPLQNVQIGISTVPPELVRDMLPPGVLQHTFDITIQAPGVATFADPVQITFPNVFDAAPGTKLSILSFDHTTGMLVINGTGTVSADGLTVASDPDSGIRAPGWHGLAAPGGPSSGPCAPGTGSTVDVPPVPDSFGLQDYFFYDDKGTFRFGVANMASKIDPSKDPCAPVNMKATPMRVEISVDGPVKDFLTGLTFNGNNDSFPLYPQQQKQYKVDVNNLLNKIRKYNEDILYGCSVTIKAWKDGAPGALLIDETIYIYRFLDAADSNHTDGTIEMADTAVDGSAAGSVARTRKIIDFTGPANPTLQLSPTPNFHVDNSTKTITFDPTQVKNDLSADILLITPEGASVTGLGRLSVRGDGVLQKWYVDRAAFEAQLAALYTPGETTVTSAIEDALLSTQANRIAIVNQAIDHAVALLERGQPFAPGLDLITTPDTDAIVVGFVLPPPQNGDFAETAYLESAYESQVGALVTSPANTYSAVERSFRLSELLNEIPGNPIRVFVPNFFRQKFSFATPNEIANTIGKTIAHEIGHASGLFAHTAGWNTADKFRSLAIPGASDDVMAQGLDLTGTKRFNVTAGALKIGLGVTWSANDVKSALRYYSTWWSRPDKSWKDGLGPEETTGDVPSALPGSALWVTDPTSGDVISELDFESVIVDGIGGASVSRVLDLTSLGDQPVSIEAIRLSGGSQAYSLDGVSAGTVIQPGSSLPLTITFDPVDSGTVSDSLLIVTDAFGGFVTDIALQGRAVRPTPQLKVDIGNNNVGGQDVSAGAKHVHGVATLRNEGLQPLEISSLTLDDTTAGFSLIDLRSGFDAAHPIILASGESIDLGISFDPSRVGIARTTLRVICNDPVTPIFTCSIVGTGTGDLLETLDWGRDYVALESSMPRISGNELLVDDDLFLLPPIRTISDDAGNWSFFLRPFGRVHYAIFDPASGLIAHGYDMTAVLRSPLTGGDFVASTEADSDFDGLPDDMEFAIGTSSAKSDTDRDGLDDFTEVDMGLDPRDGRGLPAGVLAVTGLQGEAKEVVLAARTDRLSGQLAFVATGSYGLAIVDPRSALAPIVVGQLNLPGDAVDVSLDSRLGLAAVATGASLEVVDVSNPNAPRVARSIPVAAGQVEVVDGVAYVALGSAIESYNLLTGERLDSVPAGAGNIVGLAADRSFLFAADSAGRLAAVDISGATMLPVGAIDLPASSGKVFVGGGIAYVGGGASGGFVTVDVSNPGAMVVLSGADSTAIAVDAVVATGSGDALTLGTSRGEPALYLADVRDPTRTNRIVDQFRLPSSAYSAAVGSGLAFVAGGTTGLVVVNYRPFDTAGQKPIVTASVPGADIDPATDGTQVLEGTTLDLEVAVQDDHQIARVELLVGGQVVVSDVSYPWPGSVVLPTITGIDDTVSVQLRAVDTGGNVGLSAPIELQLVRDTVAPVLIGSNVPDGAVKGTTFRVVTLEFSEALDARTVTPATVLLSDSSGTVIAAQDIRLRRDGVELQITYPALAAGSYQLRLVASAISDRAGNRLGATDVVSGLTVGQTHTVEWMGGSFGLWDDPANWSSGMLPGPGDDVVIDVAPGGLIEHRAGATTIRSLRAKGNLQISGGSFEILADSSISGTFSLTGGALAGTGTLTLAGSGNRWDGGAMTGSGTTRIAAGAELFVTGLLGDLTLADRTLLNDGTIVVDRGRPGEVLIQSSGAAAIRNLGTLEFAGKARIEGAGTGSTSGAFVVGQGATLSLLGRHRFESTASATGPGRAHLESSARVTMAGGNFDLTVALVDGAELSIEAPTTIRFLDMAGGSISGVGPLTLALPQSELLGGTITVPLVEPTDTVRPTIIRSSVANGGNYRVGLDRITLEFSEPMRPDRLVAGNFSLLDEAGTRIDPISLSIGARFRSLTLEVPGLAAGRYRLVAAGDKIEDHRAGNALASGDLTIASFGVLSRFFHDFSYPTGGETRSEVVGDVDGDGDLDIVTANLDSASVLLNRGDGSFDPRVDYALPRSRSGPSEWSANSVTLGDVDSDGDMDIVTVSPGYSSSSASVLLNQGDGSFAPRVDYVLPGGANSIALGDLDSDGNLDLVAANHSSGSVLRNRGDGSFGPRVDHDLPLGFDSGYVALGDVDRDGDLDVVTANNYSASVLLNQGDGALSPRVDYALPQIARSVALGDLDGDGDLDIVTANTATYPSSSRPSSSSIFLNNGDGSFAQRVDYALPLGARSMALGDVDGDGDLDIATANNDTSRSYSWYATPAAPSSSVLLGNGDGSFAPRVDSPLPLGEHSVALGDVDGDGKLDLVTANRNSSASVWLGDRTGSFAPRLYSLPGMDSSFAVGNVMLGDLDGDGDLDIVTASYHYSRSPGSYGRSSSSAVFLSNGDGTFAARVDYALPGMALSGALGDVDGDGHLDIVTANWSDRYTPPSFSVLLGKGDGSFAAPVNTPNPGLSGSVTLGDVDGDGDLDMVTEYRSRYSSGVSTAFLLGNGDGSFAAPLLLRHLSEVIALRDLDGDGDLDLLTHSRTASAVAVSLGHGDGSFAAPVDYALPASSRSWVALGDVDSDGDMDIVTRRFGSSSSGSSASVLLNQGDGSFGPPADYALPSDGAAVALGDVDRDGDLDIVTAGYNDSASILLGNGDGSFAAQGDYRLPWRPRGMAVGDIDGDGDADIVTMSQDYWLMTVQLNRLG